MEDTENVHPETRDEEQQETLFVPLNRYFLPDLQKNNVRSVGKQNGSY